MTNLLSFLKAQNTPLSLLEIKKGMKFLKSDSTLLRMLQALEEEKKIEKLGKGKNSKYQYLSALQYFDTPFFERPKKQYNPEFLNNYIPNKTFFLTEEERKKLLQCNANGLLNTDFIKKNTRLYEALLIDLSYSSSYLEGNTYSYLDTEILLKYQESAQGKAQEDTQMILNHKTAFDFLLENKGNIAGEKSVLFKIHELLLQKLLPDNQLGRIRKTPVSIGGSSYTPLSEEYRLKDELDIFFTKCNAIQDPFEQAFFILVFIPYFQVFTDGNKRSSRLFCNVPLLTKGLIPFSFLTVEKKAFLIGLLSIYEKNDIAPIKEVFLESYFKTYTRYFEAF